MSSSSKIYVAPLEDNDIPSAFAMTSLSFGSAAPFVNAYFPAHSTPAGQAAASKRLLAWKRTAPESMFLKAVLKQAGGGEEIIVGLAVWTHMTKAPPQTLEEAEGEDGVREYWADEREREFMRRLWKEYVKPRTRAVQEAEGKGVYVLELMAVHPEYRRMGAGRELMQWGVAAADGLEVGAVIESTDIGRKLYETFGFILEIEEMEFDVGEEFADKTKPKLCFMVRSAGANKDLKVEST